jgi:hypothetical protein
MLLLLNQQLCRLIDGPPQPAAWRFDTPVMNPSEHRAPLLNRTKGNCEIQSRLGFIPKACCRQL